MASWQSWMLLQLLLLERAYERGKAHVIGTLIGALIMQMITLTCVMNNIPDQYAQVFKAAIIVFAVFIQREQAK